jgi:hypothetical protein
LSLGRVFSWWSYFGQRRVINTTFIGVGTVLVCQEIVKKQSRLDDCV